MPDTVRDILREKVKAMSLRLQDLVISSIHSRLGGKGNLANAVQTYYEEEGSIIRGGVRIDTSRVPYARIQDKGGVIPPHMILPRNAKRLAFTGFMGDKVIVRRVNHPGAVITGQHFMTESYKTISPEITLALKRSVIEGIRAKMRQR